ncbi:MAG: hypothetical protein M3083_18035 [Actinomycetota bacterium]|nr:hypothetical protein [Actinomycetota bacterium]MDQ6947208.1 hypothetical protein [Actinomycetota bacterium]
MTQPAHATTAIPPPPGFDSVAGVDDPWLSTASDLVATLSEAQGKAVTLVPTGDPDLDRDGGLAPGTLSAIVAAPGPAATIAMVAAAYHAAYHHALTTMVYPLRSTLPQIARHLAAIHHGAEPTADSAARAAAELRDCPLYVTVGSPITVTRIHFDAVDPDMTAPNLIVVDAVDLLLPSGAARDLKHLALELNVAILCSTTVHGVAGKEVTASDAGADVAAAADTIIALPSQTAPTGTTTGGGWQRTTTP